MLCPKCGKEGAEAGDAFCRHCGFSLATRTSAPGVRITEKKPVTVADSGASKGLEIFGAAIFVVAWFFATIVAFSLGLPNFAGSVLPWLSGAIMLVGLVMLFVGFELRHSH
jgi:ribosomal protein L37E